MDYSKGRMVNTPSPCSLERILGHRRDVLKRNDSRDLITILVDAAT